MTFEFTFSILAIYEIKLIFFVFVQVVLLYRLVYDFVVDNRNIEILDKAGFIYWRICKTGGISRMISTCLDDIFIKIYDTVIFRIYVSLYIIKHNKLL